MNVVHAWPKRFQTPPKRVFLFAPKQVFDALFSKFYPLNKFRFHSQKYNFMEKWWYWAEWMWKVPLFPKNWHFWYPKTRHSRYSPCMLVLKKLPFSLTFLVTHVYNIILDWPPWGFLEACLSRLGPWLFELQICTQQLWSGTPGGTQALIYSQKKTWLC